MGKWPKETRETMSHRQSKPLHPTQPHLPLFPLLHYCPPLFTRTAGWGRGDATSWNNKKLSLFMRKRTERSKKRCTCTAITEAAQKLRFLINYLIKKNFLKVRRFKNWNVVLTTFLLQKLNSAQKMLSLLGTNIMQCILAPQDLSLRWLAQFLCVCVSFCVTGWSSNVTSISKQN